MKITMIETIPFVVPYRPDVGQSRWISGGVEKADHVLIKVHGEDGLVGYGEAMPPGLLRGEPAVHHRGR